MYIYFVDDNPSTRGTERKNIRGRKGCSFLMQRLNAIKIIVKDQAPISSPCPESKPLSFTKYTCEHHLQSIISSCISNSDPKTHLPKHKKTFGLRKVQTKHQLKPASLNHIINRISKRNHSTSSSHLSFSSLTNSSITSSPKIPFPFPLTLSTYPSKTGPI